MGVDHSPLASTRYCSLPCGEATTTQLKAAEHPTAVKAAEPKPNEVHRPLLRMSASPNPDAEVPTARHHPPPTQLTWTSAAPGGPSWSARPHTPFRSRATFEPSASVSTAAQLLAVQQLTSVNPPPNPDVDEPGTTTGEPQRPLRSVIAKGTTELGADGPAPLAPTAVQSLASAHDTAVSVPPDVPPTTIGACQTPPVEDVMAAGPLATFPTAVHCPTPLHAIDDHELPDGPTLAVEVPCTAADAP